MSVHKNAMLFAFACALLLSQPVHAGECGKASWYHEDMRTANGERYRPDGLTAAHRTLPFGTPVRVVSQRTGAAVTVRINDRGPARWTGRFIDLSRGAARVMGFLKRGVDRVCIEVQTLPDTTRHKTRR